MTDPYSDPVAAAWPTEPIQAREHRTDTGNARRFAAMWQGRAAYCDRMGGWFIYDGRCWQPDTQGRVMVLAKRTVAAIYGEAAHSPDEEHRKALASWAMQSESASGLKAMLELARSEEGIALAPDAFDRDPWLLNCQNGTLDLRTGQLREHRASDLITKLAPVEYHPDARSELWDSFLTTVTNGDEALKGFLQRAAGYALSGDTSEEKLFLVHGPGATGKSSFIETLKHALGDYSQTCDFSSFLADNRGAVRNDIAALAGCRLAVSVEVDRGKHLAEGLVKTLTGGDTVRARFLYRESFEFRPQFKLWLICNDAPQARDDDSGLWRRILRLPFEHIIPEGQRDPKLKARLAEPEHLAAVLAWAVAGCLAWQREGLQVPEVVRAATEDYRRENDPLRDWLQEHCQLAQSAQVASAALWGSYQAWLREGGEREGVNRQEFARRLTALGCRQDKGTMGVRIWKGIRLVSPDKEPSESNHDGTAAGDSGVSGAGGAGFRNFPREGCIAENSCKVTPLAPLAPLAPLEELSAVPTEGLPDDDYYAALADVQSAAAAKAPVPASAQAFVPSEEWQEVPAGMAVPPGGEYRLDMATNRSYARWPNLSPDDGDESE